MILAGAVVALAAVIFLLRAGRDRPAEPAKAMETVAVPPAAVMEQKLNPAIPATLGRLDSRAAPPQTVLADLLSTLSRLPDSEAAAAIVDFLKSGADADTGMAFRVGPDGKLASSPTLRLALLDILPTLDPLAALTVARDIMDRRTTPDEYALALRNLAWNDLDGDLRAELDRRFRDLLETPWIRQPTAGLLEAFDVAVELGDANTFARLASVAEKSSPEIARAAWMSMDRIIVRDPELLETTFGRDPDLMAAAPLQRASLLSRLDISRPAQREILTRYLAAPDHAEGELDYFSKIFPNRNYLHGHRLVTADEATPALADIAAADAATLAVLDNLPEPVSPKAAVALQSIQNRLRTQFPEAEPPSEN